jgi:hypothetical protein
LRPTATPTFPCAVPLSSHADPSHHLHDSNLVCKCLQCLDVVLKHRASYNPDCLPVGRAFFYHDENASGMLGSPARPAGMPWSGACSSALNVRLKPGCSRAKLTCVLGGQPERRALASLPRCAPSAAAPRCGWATSRACAPARRAWRSTWTWRPRPCWRRGSSQTSCAHNVKPALGWLCFRGCCHRRHHAPQQLVCCRARYPSCACTGLCLHEGPAWAPAATPRPQPAPLHHCLQV